MKQILVNGCGGPEKMELVEVPKPSPAPGQVVVKLAAIGVNFIDIYFRTGLYKAPAPVSLGMEGSGVVDAVGEGVEGVKTGDRVAYCMVRGSYAEYAAVPAGQVVAMPAALDFPSAAAAMLQGMTAHYLTHSTYPLKKGDVCLVHAAAGGTGGLIIQMAKMRGARVIGTVSTQAKAELAKAAGADDVILYTECEFDREVKRLTAGRGVDVVYDSVGASTFMRSLDSLRPCGMMVTFGNASGAVPAIEPLLLNQKGSLFLTRPALGHYVMTREDLLARSGDVLGWVASGQLKLRIDRTYPLTQAAQAHIDLASRATSGKLLLVP